MLCFSLLAREPELKTATKHENMYHSKWRWRDSFSGTINNVETSYFPQLKMRYLMTTFRCPSDILITSWLFTARWSTWPGNLLVPCVAELVGSCIPIHACRCLPDPKCLFYTKCFGKKCVKLTSVFRDLYSDTHCTTENIQLMYHYSLHKQGWPGWVGLGCWLYSMTQFTHTDWISAWLLSWSDIEQLCWWRQCNATTSSCRLKTVANTTENSAGANRSHSASSVWSAANSIIASTQ